MSLKQRTLVKKMLYRLYDRSTNRAIADLVTLKDEVIDDTKPYVIFDPNFPWKRKEIENYIATPLLEPIFIEGKLVYKKPSLDDIRSHHKLEMSRLWDEVKRFTNPHPFYVDLSDKLWQIKHDLIEQYSKN